MSKHAVGWREGYRLMRRTGCGWFVCAFMATVWVMRGDEVEGDPS